MYFVYLNLSLTPISAVTLTDKATMVWSLLLQLTAPVSVMLFTIPPSISTQSETLLSLPFIQPWHLYLTLSTFHPLSFIFSFRPYDDKKNNDMKILLFKTGILRTPDSREKAQSEYTPHLSSPLWIKTSEPTGDPTQQSTCSAPSPSPQLYPLTLLGSQLPRRLDHWDLLHLPPVSSTTMGAGFTTSNWPSINTCFISTCSRQASKLCTIHCSSQRLAVSSLTTSKYQLWTQRTLFNFSTNLIVLLRSIQSQWC